MNTILPSIPRSPTTRRRKLAAVSGGLPLAVPRASLLAGRTASLQAMVWALLLASLAMLCGCAGMSFTPLSSLQPGVATEVDVRARLGEPGHIWPGPASTGTTAAPGGAVVARVLEYSSQPYGHRTYMADISPAGTLVALRQVLTSDSFATIQVGMARDEVLRKLGKPLAITHYSLKNQTHYDWRYRDGYNWSDSRVFSAVFGADLRVVSTGSIRDPDLDPKVDPYVLQGPGLPLGAWWFGGPVFGMR